METDTEIHLSESNLQAVEEFRQRHRTGVLTFLFTDMVGSTALKQRLGDASAGTLIKRHHTLIRQKLALFQEAEEISTEGDSFFIVFIRPSDSVRFALILQDAVRAFAREVEYLIQDRVGIHMGEVYIEKLDGEERKQNFLGMQVDTSARIMSLAQGGQILLSRSVFDNARTILKGEMLTGLAPLSWVSHGFYSAKGVAEPFEICEAGEENIAPLVKPAGNEKTKPLGESREELGWRPAVGVVVPDSQGWMLERMLGEGEFGEVWLGRNAGSNTQGAFKFCFKRDRVAWLKREARLLEALKDQLPTHQNIVKFKDVMVSGDHPPYYIIMEYVEGPSLEDWLRTNPSLAERLEVAAQVADALDAIHACGIFHRDVKPSNILLARRPDGSLQAKLSDFGLGTAADAELIKSVYLSRVDGTAGTWDYIAPELRKGGKASPQSDLYSLGVTLYQIVVGDLARPLAGNWERQIESEVLRQDIQRCVAGQPEERWRRAGELATALRSHDQCLRERQLEREHERQRRRVRRLRIAVGMVLLFAAVVLGFGGFALYQWRKANRATQRAVSARAQAEELIDFMTFDMRDKLGTIGRLDLMDDLVNAVERYHSARDKAAAEGAEQRSDDDLRRRAVNYNTRADTLKTQGNLPEAEKHYRNALAISETLAARDKDNAVWQRDLSINHSSLGDLMAATGNLPEAEKHYRNDLAISETLAARDKNNAVWQRDLSVSHNKLGDLMKATGNLPEAEKHYRNALEIIETLAARDKSNADWQSDLSVSHNKLGDFMTATGNLPEAEKHYRKALEISETLAARDTFNAVWQR
ncbi:MAG: protein kinase, partial [Candidatus Sumerlaeota bacterium]|nr:protein kinase [Candidatus Sumerlaeota bacterium]